MKEKRILKNTKNLLIFHIAKMLFPFITLPYLTRILSLDSYGMVAYIKTVMSYMQILVDFGFVLSATKDIVNSRDNKRNLEYVLGDTLLAKIILGLGAFIVLMLMSVFVPIIRQHMCYTVLSYIVIFISIFLLDFLFRGLEVMHTITFRFIIMKTISTILTFIFVKGDNDILLIPIFDILGSFFAVMLVVFEIKKLNLTIRFSGIKKTLQSIRDSFIYFLNNVASTSFNALSTLVIGVQINSTEVAYWSVCMQIINAIQACYTPISDGIYPEMIKNKDLKLIKRIIKWGLPIVLAGCIIAYVIAEIVLLIIGGNKYLIAVPVFRILILVLLFGFLAIILGWPTLGSIDKSKEITTTTIVTMVIHILLLGGLIAINQFTLINIAIVRSTTELILFSTRFYYFKKYKYLFPVKLKDNISS